MQKKSISWILDFTSKLPNDEEKIKCLRANDVVQIRTVLNAALNPDVEWLLPEGDPPYIPNETKFQESVLYAESRKIYLFLKGGNDNLHPLKREKIFIDMLETVDPDDAKLLLAAKNKTLPYPGLDARIVQLAFPDIF